MLNRKGRFPKGRVTIRKVKDNGVSGYAVNIAGKLFDESNNKRKALDTAKFIREQQGKKAIKRRSK